MNSIKKIQPHLRHGIPALKIPPMEPFRVSHSEINTNGLTVTYNNITIHHLTEFILKDIRVDLNSLKMFIAVEFPYIQLLADHITRGKFLGLEIYGSGTTIGNYSNYTV